MPILPDLLAQYRSAMIWPGHGIRTGNRRLSIQQNREHIPSALNPKQKRGARLGVTQPARIEGMEQNNNEVIRLAKFPSLKCVRWCTNVTIQHGAASRTHLPDGTAPNLIP